MAEVGHLPADPYPQESGAADRCPGTGSGVRRNARQRRQTTALSSNIEAANLWAFFPAKTIRMTAVQIAIVLASASIITGLLSSPG